MIINKNWCSDFKHITIVFFLAASTETDHMSDIVPDYTFLLGTKLLS